MAIESTLDLCEGNEYALDGEERKPWYVSREGSVLQTAPQLLREGYSIASIALIMHQKRHSSKDSWRDRYFGGSDLFAYHRDGRVKYVPDGLAAIDLFALLPVENGAFIGDDALYNALPGEEFHRASLILNRVLTREGRANHALWRAAFRDVAALHDYGSKFHVGESAMGVSLAARPEQTRILVACVFGLEDRSWLSGIVHLDLNVGGLVGVLPEALRHLTRKYPYLASRGAEVRSALDGYFASRSRLSVISEEERARGSVRGTERDLQEQIITEKKNARPYEVKSESGFQMAKEHDIVVDEAGAYVRTEDVLQATNVIESGGKYPSGLIEDFKKTLRRNLLQEKQ
jgi:hypothetical protein